MKQEKYKIGDRDYFYEKFQRFLNEDKLNETGTIDAGNAISSQLKKFLTDIVIPKSKGYVNNERDAALLLYDILKHKYNIG